jgi:AbrB family looped-hinge helix DNA binding protein
MHDKKLYGTATVGTKGQIVIPSEAREVLGINTGDKLYVVGSCKSGFVGLLKEEMLEQYIEHINLQVENLKTIKQSGK